MKKPNILWFNQIRNRDVEIVGGKNASLGEMYQMLQKQGVHVPNGFAVTANAFFLFLKEGNIEAQLKRLTTGFSTKNTSELKRRGSAARALILKTPLPAALSEEIAAAYQKLENITSRKVAVAVRSSATAEDLPSASFAGQQETYLNVRGPEDVIARVKQAFASLYTDRAISYRADKGFTTMRIGLSVGVQVMVRSDVGASGVIFTLHTETGFPGVILLTGSYGLGEAIVQGAVNPDEWMVHKDTLRQGYSPIIRRSLGSKKTQTVYAPPSGIRLTNVPTKKRDLFCLNDREVLKLAKAALTIEDHYSRLKKKWQPMDIEWAKDGVTGKLHIVQARPETVYSQQNDMAIQTFALKQRSKVLLNGAAVGRKIVAGRVRVMRSPRDLSVFKTGEVLVTEITDPDWEPIMKKAAAIITDKGGRTSHAAIVSRELGVPAIVGTGTATRTLRTGDVVTVDCASGATGQVWEGKLSIQKTTHHLAQVPKTRTKIMMNIGTPEEAFEQARLPSAGVGLAREEFIIASSIQIHPMALLRFATLPNSAEKRRIAELTRGYRVKKDFFVERLTDGIAQIAAAFYPRPVIVRFSDFKSNEYAQLLGGKSFEPHEENPMIGWRGASRYYDARFADAFGLECRSLKRARERYGLKNIIAMIPFCRTTKEAKQVLEVMAAHGLRRGEKGLKVYVMCEIPANVILAADFLKLFDGFSIGSNDLAQLTLGIDRDGELVRNIADERNPAVQKLLRDAILAARKAKKYSGICGQAPSDYPELAAMLVKLGIGSISLAPDTVLATTLRIARVERGA